LFSRSIFTCVHLLKSTFTDEVNLMTWYFFFVFLETRDLTLINYEEKWQHLMLHNICSWKNIVKEIMNQGIKTKLWTDCRQQWHRKTMQSHTH
jgi:hypothetical protein